MWKYDWKLKEAKFAKNRGKVFSCFSCGGGSTMGYKLSGYDVIGCNEIDPRMMKAYVKNHNPKYPYLEPIQEFKLREDLPEELYNLDILDGSPPCSSFSTLGVRERDWGKEKVFAEGQSKQVLDTLFFDFIDLARKLQPKVVVAENVMGIIKGKAIEYAHRVIEELDDAGYYCDMYLLDAQRMGVPQRRERVFFLGIRKDIGDKIGAVEYDAETGLKLPKIDMNFDAEMIPFSEISDFRGKMLRDDMKLKKLWDDREFGDISTSDSYQRLYGKSAYFSGMYLYPEKVCPTLGTKCYDFLHFHSPQRMSETEVIRASTFPEDYDFCGMKSFYLCGMSVPPLMMKGVADRVYQYWLSKL